MSIGYGDIVATSFDERTVAIATELFGAVCFGLLLMFVSDFAKGDPIIRRRGEKEFVLKSYLRHYSVPRSLSKKIQLYYNSIWDLKSQIDLDALHDSMPMSQCATFVKINNKDMLDRTPWLRKQSDQLIALFMRDMSAMRVENRSIYQHWRHSDGLCTITNGVVEIRDVDRNSKRSPDDVRNVLALETSGQYFGDESITLVSKLYVQYTISVLCCGEEHTHTHTS